MAVDLVTDENFEDKIKSNPKVVVKYFADWCGSCRLFAPKFKRLSNDENNQDILFLDINAENNPGARSLADVKNLPTFAIFENGQFVEAVCTNKEEAVVELIDKLK
jgi:thiol-disulfide isomerase/thioredoxin